MPLALMIAGIAIHVIGYIWLIFLAYQEAPKAGRVAIFVWPLGMLVPLLRWDATVMKAFVLAAVGLAMAWGGDHLMPAPAPEKDADTLKEFKWRDPGHTAEVSGQTSRRNVQCLVVFGDASVSWHLKFECAGFQFGEYHVPDFALFSEQLGFLFWPGPYDDPMLPQFLRILCGFDPHPAINIPTPESAALALPLKSLLVPGSEFPRKGTVGSWIERELAGFPILIDRVTHEWSAELLSRPLEKVGFSLSAYISLRITIARDTIAVFSTRGMHAVHVKAARECVAEFALFNGCGIEVVTSEAHVQDGEFRNAMRIMVTRNETTRDLNS